MTETSYPVTTITGHDFTPAPLLHDPLHHQRHGGAPMLDDAPEDDGQISCICGYFDDDGWTVACDLCNRWQHQLCYYPQYEDRALPEDLQHYCVECEPRPFDGPGARARQQLKREEQPPLVNGVKRQAPKSHKKKVKEPGYTNGWPLDKSRHDRNSASPRDQPPPAKRPKTSHRASDSVTNASTKGHSRKRTASNINHRRSLSRSPEFPSQLYSQEFIHAYLEDDWDEPQSNLHDGLAVSNALSAWLSATDEEFREMHGHEKPSVLNRWDGNLDDIPGRPQISVGEQEDPRMADADNNVPRWKVVSVEDSVADGGFLGELKGRVGFKEDFIRDPKNRWSTVRHPTPFVFFHPRLPIYIDARDEGSLLRYVRRSCKPNARLQILVTNQTTYHFCFMATQQIDPGMEIAVGWDTSGGLPELMNSQDNGVSQRDMLQLSSWVSNVLANCGPCACSSPHDCLMARFDRRTEGPEYLEDETRAGKKTTSKKKKSGPHISPLNTQFASRSGSEARKVDPDDSDSRSASGSAAGRGGSASRDITPNTHYSHTGSLSNVPELSERERKKLAKEEEMFRRQEVERTGGKAPGKKKRSSGGSTLNTPSATSSSHKQLGFGGSSSRYADAGTSKQSGLPSAKPGRRPKGSKAPSGNGKSSITRTVKRPKPEYVHADVQCDMDAEEADRRAQLSPTTKRPYVSLTQRLLQRCALNNARRKGPAAVAEVERELGRVKVNDGGGGMEVDQSPPPPQVASEPEPVLVLKAEDASTANDAEMKDAEPCTDEAKDAASDPPQLHQLQQQDPSSTSSDQAQAPTPAPPWPSQQQQQEETSSTAPTKPPDMHLQMPPPAPNPFAGAPSLQTATSSSAVSASPSSLISPSAAPLPSPSPMKKKMSLSDYTKRSKASATKVETGGEGGRDSSPAAAGSSAGGGGGDVKMEDVGSATGDGNGNENGNGKEG